MATLYPENTNYGASGSIGPTAVSKLLKAKLASLQAQKQQNTEKKWVNAYSLQTPTSFKPAGVSDISQLGSPVGKQFQGLTMPLSEFNTTSGEKQDIASPYKGRNVDATDQSLIANMGIPLGGGQYLTDPSQPGKLLKAERGKNAAGNNTAEDQLIRGDYNPYTTNIDHIIPLWAGGANTVANKQVLTSEEHEIKTKMQAVPMMLYYNGEISLSEARSMAINWKDKDYLADNIKTFNSDNGTLDINEAREIKNRWNETKPVSVTDILKEVPEVSKKFLKKVDAWGEKNMPGPVWEFAKGGMSSFLMGYPSMHADADDTKVDKVANAAGSIVGTIAAYVFFEKALAQAAGKLGLKSLTASTPKLTTAIPWAEKGIAAGKGIPVNINGIKKSEKIARIASDMAKMVAFGQLQKQENGFGDMEGRMKRVLSDVVYGGVLGSQGHTLGGYATVGAASFGISLIETQDATEALKSAIIISALHGLGHGTDKSIKAKQEAMVENAANESASKVLGLWNKKYEQKKYNPEELTVIRNEALDNMYKLADRQQWTAPEIQNEKTKILIAAKQIYKGGLARDARLAADVEDLQSIGTTFRDMKNTTGLKVPPKVVEMAKNVEYLFNKKNVVVNHTNVNPKQPVGEFPVSGVASHVNKEATASVRYFAEAQKNGNASEKVIAVNMPEMEPVIRALDATKTKADLEAGTRSVSKRPENFVQVYGFVKGKAEIIPPEGVSRIELADGTLIDILPLGKAARRDRIDFSPQSFNETARKNNIEESGMMNPENNKDTLADGMKENGLDFLTLDVAKVDPKTIASGQPFALFSLSPSNWSESAVFSKALQKATSGYSLPSVLNAVKNGADEGALTRLATLQKEAQNITKASQVVEKTFAENSVGKQATQDIINDFEKAIETGSPVQVAEQINAKYGDIVDKDLSEALVSNRNKLTVSDVLDVVYDGILQGRAKPETKAVYTDVITPFFKGEFGRSTQGNIIRKTKLFPEEVPAEVKVIQEEAATKNYDIKEPPEFLAPSKKESVVTPVLSEKKPDKTVKMGRFSDNKVMDKPAQLIRSAFPEKTVQVEKLTPFTKEEITTLVSDVKKAGGSKYGQQQEFIARFEDLLSGALGTKYTLEQNEIKDLAKFFRNASGRKLSSFVTVNNELPEGVTIAPLTTGSTKYMGQTNEKATKYATSLGASDEAIEIVSLNDKSKITKDGKEIFNDLDKHDIVKESIDKYNSSNNDHLLFLGKKGKTLSSYTFAHLKDGTYQKMLEKFESNPKKYVNTKDSSMTSLSDNEKVFQVWQVDVVGTNKVDAAEMNKRTALIYNNFYQLSSPNLKKKVKMYVLPSSTIKEVGGLETGRIKKTEGYKDLLKAKEDTAIFDGQIFATKGLSREIKSGNFEKDSKTAAKPIINALTNDGELQVHKGMIRELDRATTDFLKEKYGFVPEDGALISFSDNAKIGTKGFTDPDFSKHALDITLGDIYVKHASFTEGATVSHSLITKFINEHGLNKVVGEMSGKRFSDWQKTTEALRASKNGTEIASIIENVAERYKIDPDSLFYGVKTKILKQGAGKKILGNDIEKLVKNLFVHTVLSDKAMGANKLYITSNFPLYLDGPNNPKRLLKTDEVLMSKKQIAKMGLKEGDKVLMGRNPVTDLNNLSVNKIIEADKFGLNFGKDFVSTAPHDIVIKKDADYDGDSVFVFKLGEDGVPPSFADVVEKYATHDTLITGKTKREKMPLSQENIWQAARNQSYGDFLTGRVSSLFRSMDIIKDNDLHMRVSKNKVEMFSGKNQEPVHTVKLKTPLKDFNSDVIVQFKTGETERNKIRKLQSAAIDSSSDRSLEDIINGDLDYHLKVILDARNAKGEKFEPTGGVLNAIKNGLAVMSEPFRAIKESAKTRNMDDLMSQIKPHIDMVKKIERGGGKITPQQEIFKTVEGARGIGFKPGTDVSKEDSVAVQSVMEKFASSKAAEDLRDGNYSEKVGAIMETVKKIAGLTEPKYPANAKPSDPAWKAEWKKKVSENLDKKRELTKAFKKRLEEVIDNDELSEQDRAVLAYWAATNKYANMKQHPSWHGTVSRMIERPNELISLDDDIAQTYFKAFEELGN